MALAVDRSSELELEVPETALEFVDDPKNLHEPAAVRFALRRLELPSRTGCLQGWHHPEHAGLLVDAILILDVLNAGIHLKDSSLNPSLQKQLFPVSQISGQPSEPILSAVLPPVSEFVTSRAG